MPDNSVSIFFSPKHPVIWFAEYHSNINELKIPKCLFCNNLIKVKNYNNIICNHCNNNNVTWSLDDGAIAIPINHFILEFDEKGNETINYKILPIDGMVKFGLLDPSTFIAYGIELLTGYITINDFRSEQEPFYLATGINTDTVSSNLIKISDKILNGEADLELYYGKRAIVGGDMRISMLNHEILTQFDMDPKNVVIDNIALGYMCKTDEWDFEIMIRIDCNNHLPYFTSKSTPVQKQENK